ncbi:NAD-dependent glucose-6-phosphate dehydrogenase [Geodia barretti]|uniref:NAD-dependent glucose-6-phosphate dehydrogenase n=1 Tax=Geodia barretti TaxID=519541 RepID=A0AA35S185_GEOBA|nr:NAD-dependent glucose-6-phosphate dehydrogenase [Geodia barretti]
MPKPKLLITGINGLIGRVIQDPLGKSFEVYGLDLTPPVSDRVFQADIADPRQVSQVLDNLAPVQCVVHLAAQISVDTAWEPVLRVNIQGTRNLYEAARVSGVKRVVFASSNHVTGAYEGFAPHLHLHRQAEPVPIS